MANVLDPRLHAFRADLADERLKGQVKAEKFVAGLPRRVVVAVADMKMRAESQAPLMSQLLLGDDVLLFEQRSDFCFIQSCRDHYVGYVATSCLGEAIADLTHYVCVPRTFLYPTANMKVPILTTLSLGSKLTIVDFVESHGTPYGLDHDGRAIFAGHLAKIGDYGADYVTVAENLECTPYLWGGISAFGIDCSGLVQLSLACAGQSVLRDSDMQNATLGDILSPEASLRRGDLVFWRGHVAIMCDEETLIHANGATMDVRYEPYAKAVERIARHYGMPIAHRRLGVFSEKV